MAQFDEVKPTLEAAIKRDSRSQEPRNARIQQVKQMYGYKENPNLEAYLTSQINKHGQYDSTFVYEVLAKSNEPIFTFAKDQKTPVSALVKHLNYKTKLNNESAVGYIMSFVENKGNEVVMNYYADNLIRDDKDYSNLLNEYRDGMLLYEISNRKVWEGASRDTTGLNNYYASNRAKYTWDSPRFKGIILSAKNDSTLQAVQADLRTMRANSETLDSITMRLHKKYNTDIKMERMTPMAQGENKVVDYLFFNGPQPDGKYPVAFVLDGSLIDQPQELNDVRGQVTSDYQEVLEKRWNDELAAKYPVKINKKVLKQIK